jgi:hypothetical protein
VSVAKFHDKSNVHYLQKLTGLSHLSNGAIVGLFGAASVALLRESAAQIGESMHALCERLASALQAYSQK